MKNKRDRLFFTQLFVPQASQSSYDRRAELDVRLAIPSAQSACGMEIFTKNGMAVSAMPFFYRIETSFLYDKNAPRGSHTAAEWNYVACATRRRRRILLCRILFHKRYLLWESNVQTM